MQEDDEKRAPGRPRTMDAEKTLDAAMTAYWQADPADVSVNAICQMAGVSKPSLYRQFGSEDGLMRAALERYAERVLVDIFGILAKGLSLRETLDALTAFASRDPKMETGCLFYKMRAGKHRLGPETQAKVDEIDAAAVQAFASFFAARREAGDWAGDLSAEVAGRYLVEQIGLALTQRAGGEDPDAIQATLKLALSVLRRP